MTVLLLPSTNEDLRKRDDRIKRKYSEGTNGVALAKEFGLSKPRVFQILKGGRRMYCRYCAVLLEDTNMVNTGRCKDCNEKIIEKYKLKALEKSRLRAISFEEKEKEKKILEQKREEMLKIEKRIIKKFCEVCKKEYKAPINKTGTYCFECMVHLSLFEGRERTREVRRMMDKHTCQGCRKIWIPGTRRFDVHHIGGNCGKKSRSYDKVASINGLITLCHRCHFNQPDHTFSKK